MNSSASAETTKTAIKLTSKTPATARKGGPFLAAEPGMPSLRVAVGGEIGCRIIGRHFYR